MNTDGRRVRVLFRGLRELNVIHEPLEDGSELMYGGRGVPEERLREWGRPRERLVVFAPVEGKPGGPNYLPEVFKPLVEGLTEDEPFPSDHT